MPSICFYNISFRHFNTFCYTGMSKNFQSIFFHMVEQKTSSRFVMPSVAERPCDPADIDFIVVPGVAFTAAGARMGRGRGYYDKYLSQPGFRGVKAGVCYAHQLVGELPVEPHDVFMDYVVTND